MATEDNPVARLLAAFDKLDSSAMEGVFAPDVQMVLVDGRRANGRDAAQQLIADFQATLRQVRHEITRVWHPDDYWIAEITATYELRDWHELRDVPRLFIVRAGSQGITELRAYGAMEEKMSERMVEEIPRIGGHLMLPL
jgi:hypothetical protein